MAPYEHTARPTRDCRSSSATCYHSSFIPDFFSDPSPDTLLLIFFARAFVNAIEIDFYTARKFEIVAIPSLRNVPRKEYRPCPHDTFGKQIWLQEPGTVNSVLNPREFGLGGTILFMRQNYVIVSTPIYPNFERSRSASAMDFCFVTF
jgi:hypothetical protein